ncbi:helix-turn-helix transcriptional regulator [Gallibacterium anatis]|uniref:helix-turn-helix domain-containing protein n=1 Tax=Gallibacterium anatis TaxID=750 RepID=UPI0038D3737E
MSISNCLKEMMEYKGLSIKAFAELFDVPYRTLQNYLLNERNPSAEVLIKVSEILDVNLNWLIRGQGEMLDHSSINDLSEKEQILIDHYRMMPNDIQNYVGYVVQIII